MRKIDKRYPITIGLLLAVAALALVFLPKRTAGDMLDEVQLTDSTEVEEIVYKYGIPTDDYEVDYGIVKQGQNLSYILADHGLSHQQVHRVNEKAAGVFDVRKIRAGQAYAVFTTRDSVPQTAFLVYEEDPKAYVVFDLRGDCAVRRGENPSEWRQKEVKGRVESSLWVAMQNEETSPLLAMVLSNIYGWSIDFFDLKKADEFRVIYEQEYVDGKSLDNFHVLAAAFRHSDSTYYAIPFTQDNEELYYNEKGNSLEGAFLKAPLDFYRISSRFSNARFHPVLKGVDYAAPAGTPVYAVGNGKVIAKAYQRGGAGNYLKIKHNSVYTTTYMHLSRFAKGIQVGRLHGLVYGAASGFPRVRTRQTHQPAHHQVATQEAHQRAEPRGIHRAVRLGGAAAGEPVSSHIGLSYPKRVCRNQKEAGNLLFFRRR